MTGIFMGAFTSGGTYTNSIVVLGSTNSEPFTIDTRITNNTGAIISSVQFDFTTTQTSDDSYIVIGSEGPTSVTPPAGGTASYFGSGAIFGFNFTSFDPLDVFTFRWDPDSAANPNYGGLELDFLDGIVTCSTSSGNYSGVFVRIGSTSHVQAILNPVP